MIYVILTLLVAPILIPLVYYGGYGKFWHKHTWKIVHSEWVRGIYSRNENEYIIVSCQTCPAFKATIGESRKFR